MQQRPVDAYLDSASVLWPHEFEPRLIESRGSNTQNRGRRLLVLPSHERPRLLVPADNKVAAARAMLRFSAALSVDDTVKRLGVAALLRTAGNRAFPDVIEVEESADSLTHRLGEIFGQPVDVSLGLGTARINRKPVLQVFDRQGRDLGFAKLGQDEFTDTLVHGEAASLRQLADVDLPHELHVPELVHDGTWQGRALLVMTTLPNSPWQRPRRQFDVPWDSMRQLHEAFAVDPAPLRDTPFWHTLRARADTLILTDDVEELHRRLVVVDEALGDAPVTPGAWHGDWTPWNMSRTRGRVQLWDWERLETGAPAGLDSVHYGVNALSRRDGVTARSVQQGLAMGLDRLDPRTRPITSALYLASICVRYLEGAQRAGDSTITRTSGIMLRCLHDSVASLKGNRRG